MPEHSRFKNGNVLKTGWHILDGLIEGLHPGQLVILASRPGMGKTSFGINLAHNVAKSSDKRVAFFSYELDSSEVSDRFARLDECPEPSLPAIFISDSISQTTADILENCTRIGDVGLIVIDNLQLMRSSSPEVPHKSQMVRTLRELKQIAKELKCPIVLLSQLRRYLEDRENKRPQLLDLYKDWSVGREADIIMFLYRDEYYDPLTPKQEIAELIVAKNQGDRVGTIKLRWRNDIQKFESLLSLI
ncbi:MAG: DnaB-like helicase C-terminal domain-containing protein [Bdellovibrio sp.]|nr:DnaB-like helicase C-terminal domain-containing protein [Bdellovibrio sp.]